MDLGALWAWTVGHAFLVLSGLYVASILCSAMLAIVVYRLHRQQKNLAERQRATFDTASKRLQGLEDRLAILALSVGSQPTANDSVLRSVAPLEEIGRTESSLRAVRAEIERLTTQLNEPDYLGRPEAAAQPDSIKDSLTEIDSNGR